MTIQSANKLSRIIWIAPNRCSTYPSTLCLTSPWTATRYNQQDCFGFGRLKEFYHIKGVRGNKRRRQTWYATHDHWHVYGHDRRNTNGWKWTTTSTKSFWKTLIGITIHSCPCFSTFFWFAAPFLGFLQCGGTPTHNLLVFLWQA